MKTHKRNQSRMPCRMFLLQIDTFQSPLCWISFPSSNERHLLLIFFPLSGVTGSVFPPFMFALPLSSCSLLTSFTSLSSHFACLLWKPAHKHNSRSNVYLTDPPTSPLTMLIATYLWGPPVESCCLYLKYSIENPTHHNSSV